MAKYPLRRVPSHDRPRIRAWETDCEKCSSAIYLGVGSMAAMIRLIDKLGRICTPCREKREERFR